MMTQPFQMVADAADAYGFAEHDEMYLGEGITVSIFKGETRTREPRYVAVQVRSDGQPWRAVIADDDTGSHGSIIAAYDDYDEYIFGVARIVCRVPCSRCQ